MVRRKPREGTMSHHQLIRIDDVIHLTTRELRELDARLRQILDHNTDLTDRDIAIILASLTNIRAAFDLRHLAPK
jgi:exonuclease V gamma subunit